MNTKDKSPEEIARMKASLQEILGDDGQGGGAHMDEMMADIFWSAEGQPNQPSHPGLRDGCRVELTGLSKVELNGQRGTITGGLPNANGRWAVTLEAGEKELAVKPANLLALQEELQEGAQVELVGLTNANIGLNGQIAIITGGLNAKGRWPVTPDNAGGMELSVLPANLATLCEQLHQGARVVLTGLSKAHLNGQLGTVTGELNAKGRLPVALGTGEKKISVKPVNLVVLSHSHRATNTPATPDTSDSPDASSQVEAHAKCNTEHQLVQGRDAPSSAALSAHTGTDDHAAKATKQLSTAEEMQEAQETLEQLYGHVDAEDWQAVVAMETDVLRIAEAMKSDPPVVRIAAGAPPLCVCGCVCVCVCGACVCVYVWRGCGVHVRCAPDYLRVARGAYRSSTCFNSKGHARTHTHIYK